jgi:hypothetical protein
MQKKIIYIAVSVYLLAALILVGCGVHEQAVPKEQEGRFRMTSQQLMNGTGVTVIQDTANSCQYLVVDDRSGVAITLIPNTCKE